MSLMLSLVLHYHCQCYHSRCPPSTDEIASKRACTAAIRVKKKMIHVPKSAKPMPAAYCAPFTACLFQSTFGQMYETVMLTKEAKAPGSNGPQAKPKMFWNETVRAAARVLLSGSTAAILIP